MHLQTAAWEDGFGFSSEFEQQKPTSGDSLNDLAVSEEITSHVAQVWLFH